MNRFLLAVMMLTVVSGPALASYPKAQDELAVRHVASAGEHRQSMRMPTGRGEASDPYWTPCDYYSDYGPNSCE